MNSPTHIPADLAKTHHVLSVLPDYIQDGRLEKDSRDFYSTFARDYPPHPTKRPVLASMDTFESHLPIDRSKGQFQSVHKDVFQDPGDLKVERARQYRNESHLYFCNDKPSYESTARNTYNDPGHCYPPRSHMERNMSSLPIDPNSVDVSALQSTAKENFKDPGSFPARVHLPYRNASTVPLDASRGVLPYATTAMESYVYHPLMPERVRPVHRNKSDVVMDERPVPIPQSTAEESYKNPKVGSKDPRRNTHYMTRNFSSVPTSSEPPPYVTTTNESFQRPRPTFEKIDPPWKNASTVPLQPFGNQPMITEQKSSYVDPNVPTEAIKYPYRNHSSLPMDDQERTFVTTTGAHYQNPNADQPIRVIVDNNQSSILTGGEGSYATTSRDQFQDPGLQVREKPEVDKFRSEVPFCAPGDRGLYSTTMASDFDQKPLDLHSRVARHHTDPNNIPIDPTAHDAGLFESTYTAQTKKPLTLPVGRRRRDVSESAVPLAKGFYYGAHVKQPGSTFKDTVNAMATRTL